MPKRVDVLPPIAEPRALPPGSNLPALIARRRRANRYGWIAILAVVVVIVVGGLVAREEITAAWPPASRLYHALGFALEAPKVSGLEFRNVSSKELEEGGVPILLISGEIENVSGADRRVPAIRVGLLDANERELHHWTFAAEKDVLEAGTRTSFQTRLTSPPPGAASLSVRFATDGRG
jgi:hypothetical protein